MAPYVEDEPAGDARGPPQPASAGSLVAGVWAVAATALGVIALIEANKDDTERPDRSRRRARPRPEAAELGRIDDLESRIDDLPTSDDVSKLDDRLKAVEDDADKSRAAADKLSGRVDALETQVDDLETARRTTLEQYRRHRDHRPSAERLPRLLQ